LFITSQIVRRMGADLEDDPEYQARIADGRLVIPTGESGAPELTYTKEGRNAAYIFLAGVVLIVVFGLFPDLRPQISTETGDTPISVTVIIQMVMMVAAAGIMLISKPDMKIVPDSSVFRAGMISA